MITENENTPQVETTTSMDAANYIEELNKIKANSVDKSAYDKLVEDNRKLANALTQNRTIAEDKPEAKPDIAQLRKDLYKENEMTNLEYCKKTLELRQALVDAGERDPFLPYGHHNVIEESDVSAANQVAEFLQTAIETADGNADVFNDCLKRGLIDSVPSARSGRHNII